MDEKNPNFTFRLASPQYRRFLDFIAKDEKTTPGKVLNRLIHREVHEIIDARASEKAHKELSMKFAADFDIKTVAWVRGSRSDHWQRLSRSLEEGKAEKYQKAFLPLYDKYYDEIDKAAGLDYRNYERRRELEIDSD